MQVALPSRRRPRCCCATLYRLPVSLKWPQGQTWPTDIDTDLETTAVQVLTSTYPW